MKSVGIKELKNNLSRYLKLITERGEVILVTDRDDVVAEMHQPIFYAVNHRSRWEAFMLDQERRGSLRRAKRTKSGALQRVKQDPRWDESLDWKSVHDQTRADRF